MIESFSKHLYLNDGVERSVAQLTEDALSFILGLAAVDFASVYPTFLI